MEDMAYNEGPGGTNYWTDLHLDRILDFWWGHDVLHDEVMLLHNAAEEGTNVT